MRRLLALAALLSLPFATLAQESKPVRAYIFGNSLIHHLSDSSLTNVPVWLDRMAKADGRSFGVDGQWGFLRDFSRTLPPIANWSFSGVRGVWNPEGGDFGGAGFTAVLINPANFIQYQPPDAPFDGGDGQASPVSETLRVFDWTRAQDPNLRHYIYEGWAEMAGVAGRFPPSDRALRRYHAFNQGDYHNWYQAYLDAVRTERPDLDVQLIPVASEMSRLLAAEPLNQIPVTALYSDDAPHGTDTLYLLAAMITYAAVFEAEPPALDLPDSIHSVFRDAYAATAKAIWTRIAPQLTQAPKVPVVQKAEVQAEPLPLPKPKVAEPVIPAADVEPGALPALGMGLNGIADWSTQHPFINVMKTAREWIGHLPGQWGGMDANQMRALGVLDADGWPQRMPEGVTHLESFVFTDQPTEATHLRGRYVLTYDGDGDLQVGGRAKRVQYSPGEIRFTYEPGEGLVSISLREIDQADPIRNIRIIREDHLTLDQAGVIFNPDWIARVKDLRSVRFMDWMFTNGSPIARWDDRPRVTDYTYTAWGVPLEVMIALANQIGADPWFNIPHMADDNYVRNFAQTLRDGLDPRLKAYVEYSNEVWNFVFPQAQWSAAQATARWGESETGWMQFYGLRSAQVMDIFTEVFGDQTRDRLVRVVATHTGWQGLEEDILLAPLAFLELRKHPKASFDAYAVTGYFGFELGEGDAPQTIQGWLDQAEALARAEGEAQGLRRVALREYLRENGYAAAYGPVADLLAEGSIAELTQVIFPYHAAVARAHGLQLVMYEGGTHVTGHGDQLNDERLTRFYMAFNYTPEVARLYQLLLDGWTRAGGTLFNAFVDVAPASQFGSWGALRHLNDANPRADVLQAFNAGPAGIWETRDPNAFKDGVMLVGTDDADAIIGTGEEDILIAGPGDDLLDTRGGADHLHGGPGEDLALLGGGQDDYRFTRDGARVLAQRGAVTVHLTEIETLAFSDAPDVFVPLETLVSPR